MDIIAVIGDGAKAEIENVDYVYFINKETFGAPPLITSKGGGEVEVGGGDTVVFINTELVALLTVTK